MLHIRKGLTRCNRIARQDDTLRYDDALGITDEAFESVDEAHAPTRFLRSVAAAAAEQVVGRTEGKIPEAAFGGNWDAAAASEPIFVREDAQHALMLQKIHSVTASAYQVAAASQLELIYGACVSAGHARRP